MCHVPREEIRLMFVRATGPGGQNVNKTATKVQLHWHVGKSMGFSAKEKVMIIAALRNRITKDGEIVLAAGETRSQAQNRETALERLDRLVTQALTPQPPRIATKPTRSSKAKRLNNKKRRSQTKQLRRKLDE